jgi:mannosyl-3-phosphoglycerate phosphatase
MSSLLVVTDLDGTLLDDNYRFDAARDALSKLSVRNIPLILNTSKTASECIYWQQQLGVQGPFICENGAAIIQADEKGKREIIREFGQSRNYIAGVLASLRASGFHFTGFADWDLQQLIGFTGLPPDQARLSLERQYSEPLLFKGSADEELEFVKALAKHELAATRGGRFLTVTGLCDKGTAMRSLAKSYGGDVTIVALGDSPNDIQMLGNADIAVVVASSHSPDMHLEGHSKRLIHTEKTGPAGWQQAMTQILEEIE